MSSPVLLVGGYQLYSPNSLGFIRILQPLPPTICFLISKSLNRSERFQKCFSPGIKIDPQTKEVKVDKDGARKDLVSGEVLRHAEFVDSVELSRVGI